PGGVGDRELVEPVRLTAGVNCWLARNPHLPALSPVLLAFHDDRDRAQAVIDWHRRLQQQGAALAGVVPLEHTYLDTQPPCLQFAGPGTPALAGALHEPGPQSAWLFRQTVEVLARLHRSAPPLAVGRVEPADVLLGASGPRLLVAELPGTATPPTPRDDVGQLGRLGRMLLGE